MEAQDPAKELAANEDRLREEINAGYKAERLLEDLRPFLESINNRTMQEFRDAKSDDEALLARRRWDAMQTLVDEIAEAVETAKIAKADKTRLEQAVEWAKKNARRLRA